MTFAPIENQESMSCNHIDCNKSNNSLSNLEWVTHKDNIHHAIKHGRFDNFFKKRDEYHKSDEGKDRMSRLAKSRTGFRVDKRHVEEVKNLYTGTIGDIKMITEIVPISRSTIKRIIKKIK